LLAEQVGLPGEIFGQVLEVVAIVVPVGVVEAARKVAVNELADDHRRAAFGEEEEGEAGVYVRPSVPASGELPGAVGALSLGEKGATFAIPVDLAEEALPGQPTGAFETVKVVEGAMVQLDREFVADPGQSHVGGGAVVVDAAVFDSALRGPRFALAIELGTGDEQAAQAGYGHRGGGASRVLRRR